MANRRFLHASALCALALVVFAPASSSAATPSTVQTYSPNGTPVTPSCPQGEFCYWASENYPGDNSVVDLSKAQSSTCVPLPHNAEARSFTNNRATEITVYEGAHCSTEGDFRTYPAGSTVPEAPFVARAVEIWD